MKKALVTAFLAGSGIALFAQTTPPVTAPPTTNPVTTTPVTTTPVTTSPVTTSPVTTSPITTSPVTTNPATNTPVNTNPVTTSPVTTYPTTNNSVTNSTSDPLNTVTNGQVGTTGTYPASTSWDASGTPYWGWNNYGIWNNSPAVNGSANTSISTGTPANVGTGVQTNTSTDMSATGSTPNNNTIGTSSDASLSSSNAYDAYGGTSVSSLPENVQTNFAKEYPNPDNRQYAWNQYGDWFNTYYTAKGRTTQYYYDQRGNGYSLSLPVIQTYVPEEIVDKALNKYGAHLYSIGMIKTADGSSAYQVGLINRGQLHSEYLNEQGTTVANVWRTEEMNMSSTSTNAAMDDQSGVAPTTNQNSNANADMDGTSTEASNYQDTTGKSKMKMKPKQKADKMKMKNRKQNADSTSATKPEEM